MTENSIPDIENYFLVGGLHSAGLISRGGSIDWLCLPHFDSPSVFARLLDTDHGGTFSLVTDTLDFTTSYIKNTPIVETKCEAENGVFHLYDFMLPQPTEECENHVLVRRLEVQEGNPEVSFIFDPRPDYGNVTPTIKKTEGESAVEFLFRGDTLRLYIPEDTKVESCDEGGVRITFQLSDSPQELVMEYIEGEAVTCVHDHEFLPETQKFWREWNGRKDYPDYQKEALIRSAITLKLMQYYPTGAIVAAPTTSLPENIGGERNWDYRYVWMRDATFTLYALSVVGCRSEARKFFEFIEHIAGDTQLEDIDLMYTIHGNEVPQEYNVEKLDGYRNSQPVRVGNEAARQFQLDVYGTLIDSVYFSVKHGMEFRRHEKNLVRMLVRQIQERWQDKDNGIWEVRTNKEHFTYSKVMAWVGMNRALQLVERMEISQKKKEEWHQTERNILSWIQDNAYTDDGRLLQHPNTTHQDATNFLFPLVKYLNKEDPRSREIIENTCEELCEDEVFVYRYLVDDGFEGEEGAFVLCSWWLISAWAILEETEKAKALFEKFSEHIADNGLMSEEVRIEDGAYLGNFPQAFSHMGHITAAHYINKYENRED